MVVFQSDQGVEGQMKEVEMDGHKILLIREKGELSALGYVGAITLVTREEHLPYDPSSARTWLSRRSKSP